MERTQLMKKKSMLRKWEDVNYDVLVKIFSTFNLLELVFTFSRVCRSWRFACCEAALWKTLDLSLLGNYFNIPSEPYAWSDEVSSQRLIVILTNALDLSGGNVLNLIFHFYTAIRDDHLIVAAQRCRNLKRLILPSWNHITLEGFQSALRVWNGLESMIVPHITGPTPVLGLIAENCNNFKELKVMCPFDISLATSIFVSLPRLRVLSLRCCIIYKNALELILDRLPYLEVLNITHCLLVSDDHPLYPGDVYAYRQIDTLILQKASRLQEFYSCQWQSCAMCQRECVDDDGNITWHECEQGLLRVDEISSLAY